MKGLIRVLSVGAVVLFGSVGCGKRADATLDPAAMPELTATVEEATRERIAGRWALDHDETLGRLSAARRGIASAYLSGLTAGIVFSPDGTWVQTVARSSGLTVTEGRYTIEAVDTDAVLLRMIPTGESTGPRRDIFIEGPDVLRFSIDGHSASPDGDPFRRISEADFDAQMKAIAER